MASPVVEKKGQHMSDMSSYAVGGSIDLSTDSGSKGKIMGRDHCHPSAGITGTGAGRQVQGRDGSVSLRIPWKLHRYSFNIFQHLSSILYDLYNLYYTPISYV